MMGRMVQVAAPTTPEDGLPAKLRDEILARACACLPEVLQRSAEFVERRHIDIDKGLDPGKTRAVATLAGRDAALKRAAVRQAINEIIEELRDPVSSGRSPESPHVIKILR